MNKTLIKMERRGGGTLLEIEGNEGDLVASLTACMFTHKDFKRLILSSSILFAATSQDIGPELKAAIDKTKVIDLNKN